MTEPVHQIRDFSDRSVRREVVKHGLSHWMTIYPPALGLPIGLAGLLFNMPLLYLVMIGSVSIGLASAIINVYFQGDKVAQRYLDKMTKQLREQEKENLKNLQDDLREAQEKLHTHGHAEQALEQFTRLQQKYENVLALLPRKLNRSELAFARFIGAAEQVYLGGLDALHNVAAILKSQGSIDPQYIEERLKKLERVKKVSDADEREHATLLKRRRLYDEQQEQVNHLLTHNEEAMTSLEETTAAIAAMRTGSNLDTYEYEEAISQLQEVAARAHIYSKT
jgi:exonuclease VII large subunit